MTHDICLVVGMSRKSPRHVFAVLCDAPGWSSLVARRADSPTDSSQIQSNDALAAKLHT
jgi:hypothetical protein